MSADPAAQAGPDTGDKRATVHDLGYKRYDGERRSQSSRYLTIVRKTLSSSWRGWWRMKTWVITAALIIFVLGTLMYVSEQLSNLTRGGQKLPFSDALLPESFRWLQPCAFVMTLTIMAGIVADDLRTGAFEFYFARPLRTRDYVLGKFGGGFLIMCPVLVIGPVLLALFSVSLADSGDVVATLHVVPKAALVGVLAAGAYAALPLAFSAISSQRRHTLAAWAAFFIIGSRIFVQVISRKTGITELAALDLPTAIRTVAYDLYDVSPLFGRPLPPAWIALLTIVGYIVVALAILYWRVAAAERRGMGGG